jgi:hypothetical protein
VRGIFIRQPLKGRIEMLTYSLKRPHLALSKIGYAGLLFFTVKGLCWLLLPLIFGWYV